MSMTWPQVRGLSYSTMGRSVRAETWADGTYTGKVWFQPPTSWRIENASGEVTYIENATDEYRRGDDGIMVHVVKSPHRWVMMTGHAPSLLLQAYSMWLPQEQGVPAQLDEPTSPREVDVRGRTGWEVQFTDQSINRTGRIVTYAIDAETGVALSRSTPGLALELSDPLIDEPFDPALFTWTGPTGTRKTSPTQVSVSTKRRCRRCPRCRPRRSPGHRGRSRPGPSTAILAPGH
ncbi:hypothetical protein GS922_22450 [Rhodococcus hoagii]|nr:hypothetical protein [Prescottella equi]